MNRFTRRDTLLRSDDEGNHERQTLIDNDELCDDEVDLFSNPLGMRNRQPPNKKTISNEDNTLELRNINKHNKTRDLIDEPITEYTYYDIQPEDSLQSICLRYACSVNQVKRINGLMTNQEFYGLRRIKLPLGKLGLLEDILRTQQQNLHPDNGSLSQPRLANSPGFALSVVTRQSQFKPLLSPGFSSGQINEINDNQSSLYSNKFDSNNIRSQLNHSHSFSNLKDFAGRDINIDVDAQHYVDTRDLKKQSFIKPDLHEPNDMGTEDLLTVVNDNVDKIFHDLDYHVERAKVAAESYDQRAAELVDKMNTNSTSNFRQSRVSKIPEIFFCSENFGLSYKKLLVFIFVVCLVVPLVYINQTNIVAAQSNKMVQK